MPISLFFIILTLVHPPSPEGLPRRHLIKGVPFLPQKKQHCGPASLAMVFQYYGVHIMPDELAREIYLKRLSGTLNLDLLIAARKHGFSARACSGRTELLKKYISREVPVIALIRSPPGTDTYHFLVVYGYDDDQGEFTAHSGRTAGAAFGYQEFLRAWEPADCWMLAVERKENWP